MTTNEMTDRKVVLSGIRATGKLHLGNYLGVLERFAKLSRDSTRRCFYFIADLHTLTTRKEAERIRDDAMEIVLDMLAAGVDPEQATIYVQSHVSVVAELAWYLACISPVGELERMPTYKDKAAKQPEDVNAGLLFYPVLMAADILGPHADLVPVGKDQEPHLEFTRELARRFNRLYGSYFPIPDSMADESLTIPGLVAMDEEGRFAKMGKSEAPHEALYLHDTPDEIAGKIRRAPTDPARARRTDPGSPQKCAIYSFHGLVSSDEELRWSAEGCRTADISCVECKDVLSRNVNTRLADFRERRAALAATPERVQEIIAAGDERARAVFTETTATVADRMGVFRRKAAAM
ncbi:tryptophan--tRNA ligase [Candidatus Uhrbacteria bacterium]|nr:tryptophan--tRNA ligase [Candidatus Uhrbacteria bacterium]